MLAEVGLMPVPPGGIKTSPVRGFCLDYRVAPPGDNQLRLPAAPAPERYADFIRCLVGGLVERDPGPGRDGPRSQSARPMVPACGGCL